MSPVRTASLAAHELRMLRRDAIPIVVMIGMPLVLIAFVKPSLRITLRSEGFGSATGAEQAVPGMAVLFAFFLIGFVGAAFFREHGYGTWDRLRLTLLSRLDVVAGKAAPALLVVAFQLSVLFVLGAVLFDLGVAGSRPALALVAAAFAVATVCLALLLSSFCRTWQQLNAMSALGAMVLGGLGGALTPTHALPELARHVSPVTPSYWAMRGFRSTILLGGDVGDVLLPVGVLLGFSVLSLAGAAARFRFDERKQFVQ